MTVTASPALPAPDVSAPALGAVLRGWARPVLAALLGVSGVALGWPGGIWVLFGALLLLAAARLAFAGHRSALANIPRHGTAQPAARLRVGRCGADLMVEHVVPMWGRQMDATRDLAVDGIGRIVEGFAEISTSLSELASQVQDTRIDVESGAVGDAVQRETPALDRLCQASQRAFDQRERIVGELGQLAEALAELTQLAKSSREIARHTRLVAFNASIEAQRGEGRADGGARAVAQEVRMLAARMGEVGEKTERQVLRLRSAIDATRRDSEVNDTSPEELKLEIRIAAREALASMLGSLSGALSAQGRTQEAAATLAARLDEMFVLFQVGDRISQMMSIIGNDMNRFATWVAQHPEATATDAEQWLAALESSYTMEEQRSHHHGNVHVQRDSGVEFF